MIIPKILLKENNIIKRPFFKLNMVQELYEKTIQNSPEEFKIPKDIYSSFELQDELNPKFWEDGKIIPKVRTSLVKIAKDFFNDLELPPNVKLKDILFTGSLANYNWSDYSDVDVHIVIDYSQLKDTDDFIENAFDAHTKLYKLNHDIKIEDFPVELYVQDIKEKLSASAIFSLKNDKWVLKPTKEKFKLDKALIKKKIDKIFKDFKKVESDYNDQEFQKAIDGIDKLKDTIKKMRQSGLNRGGEFSTENIIFKILRRSNFLETLGDYKYKAYDNLVSVNEDKP